MFAPYEFKKINIMLELCQSPTLPVEETDTAFSCC